MNLKIVYDNEAKSGFEKGWGFSCLIELEDENILFDTGWDGRVLLSNLKKLNTKPKEINRVILSHAHWDHIGGLPSIRRKDLEVYVPHSFSKRLRGELDERYDLYEVISPREITDGVWTTGELENKVKEQSLVLETEKGLLIIVGCSHPGVGKILSISREFGEIWGILGGMHEFKDFEVLEGLSLIGPAHCTVKKDEIAGLFPDSHLEVKAGLELEVGLW